MVLLVCLINELPYFAELKLDKLEFSYHLKKPNLLLNSLKWIIAAIDSRKNKTKNLDGVYPKKFTGSYLVNHNLQTKQAAEMGLDLLPSWRQEGC